MATAAIATESVTHVDYIHALRECIAIAKSDTAATAWQQHRLRCMEFDLQRLEFGQAMNGQNGAMDRKAQSKPSTPEELEAWSFNQSRRLGLVTVRENEQGIKLFAYFSQSNNLDAYQPVPEGCNV